MINLTEKKESIHGSTFYINEHTFEKGICKKMTGKMSGMQSFSTSVVLNKYCQERRNNDKLICSECFAAAMTEFYGDNFTGKLAKNTELVTSRILDFEELPYINCFVFRLESFGDVSNVNQVINYFNLCYKNQHCQFSVWTKNPWLYKAAIESGNKKPDNLNIVLSSPCINHCVKTHFDFVDMIFTVYTAEYALIHDIKINCGNRKCLECMNCYSKNHIFHVNEILKKESSFYYKTLRLLTLYIGKYGHDTDKKTISKFLRFYRNVKTAVPGKLTNKKFAAIVAGHGENRETA